MPYITKERREELQQPYNYPRTPGELNFFLTHLCLEYVKPNNEHGLGYQEYNDVIGALECCKLEMYRRAVAPYEDLKIKENGDVYA